MSTFEGRVQDAARRTVQAVNGGDGVQDVADIIRDALAPFLAVVEAAQERKGYCPCSCMRCIELEDALRALEKGGE